jgi:uncharacterized protein YciI
VPRGCLGAEIEVMNLHSLEALLTIRTIQPLIDSLPIVVYHFAYFTGGIAVRLHRWVLFSVMAVVVASSLRAQTEASYDSTLASRLGADKLGMKVYVMAFLKKGPNRNQDSAEAERLQEAHMANIGRMAREGFLVLAGPFEDDGDLRGIYLFNVSTVEEAQRLTETDPAVKAGRLVMELHPWYGSAALMEVPRIHRTLHR